MNNPNKILEEIGYEEDKKEKKKEKIIDVKLRNKKEPIEKDFISLDKKYLKTTTEKKVKPTQFFKK